MSANVVQSLGCEVGISACSSSGRCPYVPVRQNGFRTFRVRISASPTGFSNAVSSVDALKLAVGSSERRRGNGAIIVAQSALFPFLGRKKKDAQKVKIELFEAIAPLNRGVSATEEDLARVNSIAKELEKLNPTKEPLKSPLLSGKWKLIYTTSNSILKKSRPSFLRPNGPIYQAINTDTLRAQNLESWPFFNQVTANLVPVSSSKVVVNFDFFKIAGLISVKAPGRARGELEVTYLDDDLRVSRGDRGNLFVLVMEDPSYRVPLK
ncbi:hypothetical protein R1sor_019458 [Riccia sorocarpa]|uniref:Plastid lipid-associated protein/fibrillin conserved domain-containing protein n=1 Tax=Riccia sorocarpa TaxID=122646 RepID=A0ABD3ID67_9MARC